ncbi:MAG: hypothetical protein JRN20_10325 [Nitrososphaerota archaeon]|nr:hypothetical protein [Nitrososphaerota archaeon]
MGQSDKDRMTTSADLIRRGATLLQEACPKCGGVQLKYRGKIFCLNETDLNELLSTSPQTSQTSSTGSSSLRKLLEEKMASATKQLEATSDVSEQSKLLDLISKYLETLNKLGKES